MTPVNNIVQIRGFEETSPDEKGKYDFITSNIPFGNFQVYDPAYQGSAVTSKIHDYFFAKGPGQIRRRRFTGLPGYRRLFKYGFQFAGQETCFYLCRFYQPVGHAGKPDEGHREYRSAQPFIAGTEKRL